VYVKRNLSIRIIRYSISVLSLRQPNPNKGNNMSTRICTIEIKTCEDCPHVIWNSQDVEAWFDTDECSLYKDGTEFLNKDYSIPNWCPLPKKPKSRK